MKSILTFIAIAIVGVSAFTSCQKYDYNPSMGATIDTMVFSGSGNTNVFAHVDTSTHNPQLVIISGKSDVYTPGTSFIPRIILTVPNVTGNFIVDTTTKTRNAMVYTSATGSAGTVAVSGEIKITSIDGGKIKGSFTLTCADGTTVTNGQFIAKEYAY
ncbi:MAG: hypothetical protein ACHQD8_07760 [Chitinophagales bacterium]